MMTGCPGLNSLPPMARNSFLLASTSFEMRCQCPIVTPASLKGAGCAAAVRAASVDASNNATKIVLFTNTSSPRRGLLHLWTDRQALDDLEARAPRIRDVGDGVARGAFANRLIELDALRLEPLHEGGVVAHVEAEVIEHATARRRLLAVGLQESELHARK